MNTNNLFAEFPVIYQDEWKKKVLKDLRGADFNEKLCWETDQNIILKPLYDKLDTKNLDYLRNYLIGKPENDIVGMESRQWRNAQHITVKKGGEKNANNRALLALENDANEIIFMPRDIKNLDLKLLLNKIQVEYCAISWMAHDEDIPFLMREYIAYLEQENVDLMKVKGFLDSITLTNALNKKFVTSVTFKNALKSIQITEKLPYFRAITLTAQAKNITDELAELCRFTTRLLESELEPDLILDNIVLSSFAQTNYFEEIAKLRALRFLMTEIAQRYSRDYTAESIHILSVSSVQQHQDDPYQNMLSNTTQAMSAILGGCNTLCVTPHNERIEEVSPFSERIARNISNLLREESYLGCVIDPASGSYHLETLTDKLMRVAWEKFRTNFK